MNNNYYNKYLKYKNKYLILKNKKEINNINKIGGQYTDEQGQEIIKEIISYKNKQNKEIPDILNYINLTYNLKYTKKIIENIISFDDYEFSENIIYKIIKFQEEFLNRNFLATTEGSYECNESNNFYNIEWIYNGTIDYENIMDENNDIYEAINRISKFSSSCDNDGEQNVCLSGPQQTHIHVSYKDFYFTDKEQYFLFLKILSLHWIHNFQNIFNSIFIEDFDKWANDNRDACGKPLIFTTSEDEGRQILARYNAGEVSLYTTNFNGEIYYTNIPFEDISKFLDNPYDEENDNSANEERYVDLNITPSWNVIDPEYPECHVEFRALNNLIQVGEINNFIANKFGNIYNFLSLFTKYVSILFQKVFNDLNYKFDKNSLRFGIEIETCTYIDPN